MANLFDSLQSSSYKRENRGERKVLEIDNNCELNLLVAVEQISEVFEDSQLSEDAYEAAVRPINYLSERLYFTPQQAVVYSVMMSMFDNSKITLRHISEFLDISSVASLRLLSDIEFLCSKRYFRYVMSDGNKVFRVVSDSVEAMRKNEVLQPKSYAGLDSFALFCEMRKIFRKHISDELSYADMIYDLSSLLKENDNLHFVQRYKDLTKGIPEAGRLFLLLCCNLLVNDNDRKVYVNHLDEFFRNFSTYNSLRKSLNSGNNELIKNGLIRPSSSEGQVLKDTFELTPKAIKDLLAELNIAPDDMKNRSVLKYQDIQTKEMFYNPKEKTSIDKLIALLEPSNFNNVVTRLDQKGFRKGFTCLLYGGPGTGKTETVLQLARLTGRDLIQVNVTEIKDMYIGETERNIKRIFEGYRELVRESKVAPILFFNEADSIIGKRLETVHSVDKMENSMQNIILEEMEKLEGIMIATTNLTQNMDSAFERRFLFKIEFAKPSLQAKCSIWKSLIPELSEEEALSLSTRYDFSGGQIENVARKRVVDQIIMGEPLTMDAIYDYCDNESLGSSTAAGKTKMGFRYQ